MNEIEQAIAEQLRNSAAVMGLATDICYGSGHIETQYPFVVFAKQPRLDTDFYSFEARLGRAQSYIIKAVDLGMSKQRAQIIADAIDSVLTDSIFTLTGWRWCHCHRAGDIEYQEQLADGQMAWHVGGVYQITVSLEV